MIKREFLGGLTTFLTMVYIIAVNPAILSTEGTGISFSGALTATVLLSFSMTLLMGLYAKLPFAVAPGMGVNAFFVFGIILGEHIPWPTALGMVFWSGVLFLLISVTPLREKVAAAIPHHLRLASAVGIGLFLTLIGFKNAGWIVADPATFVRMGVWNGPSLSALLGLMIVLFFLRKKSPLAFLFGIIASTMTALLMGWIHFPEQLVSQPDFSSVFFKLDIWGAFKLALLPSIFSMMFTDLFDSISTFVGVSQASNLLDKDGNPLRLKQGLLVDAMATFSASLMGTSPGTAYIESAAGIEAGARTGLASVFTALLFLPCFFLAPLVGMIPIYATAPVLVVVGMLMFKNIREIEFTKIEDSAPAFLTLVMIPFSFSITKGLLCGFATHLILYTCVGRIKEVPTLTIILGLLSLMLLGLY